ncbi:MAG: hypothetical protein KJP18_13195 [Gemmatimonadetes bacterium]|nr:hypothetical protein [Gemmatimonadota bacterium]
MIRSALIALVCAALTGCEPTGTGGTIRLSKAPDFSAAVSDRSGGVEETALGLTAGPLRGGSSSAVNPLAIF